MLVVLLRASPAAPPTHPEHTRLEGVRAGELSYAKWVSSPSGSQDPLQAHKLDQSHGLG